MSNEVYQRNSDEKSSTSSAASSRHLDDRSNDISVTITRKRVESIESGKPVKSPTSKYNKLKSNEVKFRERIKLVKRDLSSFISSGALQEKTNYSIEPPAKLIPLKTFHFQEENPRMKFRLPPCDNSISTNKPDKTQWNPSCKVKDTPKLYCDSKSY
jgi:hypothetical protein